MRLRSVASIAATALAAVALAGCSLLMVPQTQFRYDPSDGVAVTVGDVRLLNLIVFSEDGVDGNLSGVAVNPGDDDVDMVLQYVSGGDKIDVEVEIPGGETLTLGSGENGQLLLPDIDVPVGSYLVIYFQYGDKPGKQVSVPVLDTALPQYDGLLPTPTPTPTPTETPAVEPTPTPTPTP